jgi:peptidoglycan/LPS O-acetylase OafA/YrhL
VEEQFYLLLPLLLLTTYVFKAGKKAFLIVPVLFVAGFAIRLLIWQYAIIPAQNQDGFGGYWTEMMYYPTYTRLDGLLVGVTIAALTKFAPVFAGRVMRYGNTLLVCSLVLLVASYFVVAGRTSFMASIFGFPLVSIAYGVLVLAAISPNCVLYKYRSKLTANIATLSYSIYLTHKGVIHLTHAGFGKLGIAPDGNLMIVISISLSVLAAIVMRQVVEKPFLRMRDKVLQKRNAKQAIAIKPVVV